MGKGWRLGSLELLWPLKSLGQTWCLGHLPELGYLDPVCTPVKQKACALTKLKSSSEFVDPNMEPEARDKVLGLCE